MDRRALLTSIPKVDEVLNYKGIVDLMEKVPRPLILESIREVLDEVREKILRSPEEELESYFIKNETIGTRTVERALKKQKPHLKRVVNATGVVIHTNLGRSLLSERAVEAVVEASKCYTNLEYDIEKGERGSRYSHVEYIISKVTGAESAMVVNNNAAAVLLVLSTLCRGKEAIVSRGELVEIGGSFRVPEVMEQSGAVLVEVGATNRTHLYDYERAIGENTGALLKVHTSNYRILGFTEEVKAEELVELGGKKGIPVIEDIGSGSFIDFSKYGLSYEPTVQEAVRSGVDIVTFSGDKMLGGPQAGIIVGRKKYIDMMKKNPLTRALRIDKMTIAALEATLRMYMDEEEAIKNIPTLRMILEPKEKIRKRAEALLEMLESTLGERAQISIVEEYSQIGGGSMPLEKLPTYALYLKPAWISAAKLEAGLREADIPVIARVKSEGLLFDLRTVDEEEYLIIRDSLDNIL